MTENSDSYQTDEWLMSVFQDWFDPCPYDDNPSVDGLQIDWEEKTFVNPPYSNPLPWIEKAIRERNKGNRVVLLLKMDTSTKWFTKLQEAGAHFLWINGRLKYKKKSYTYNKGTGAQFPSMLAVLT